MKAAVYRGEGRLLVEDIPVPVPLPGEILIKVNYSAICGTDVHAFVYDIAPTGSVMGHEFSGVVTAVGEDVHDWKIGDRVIGGGGSPPPSPHGSQRTSPPPARPPPRAGRPATRGSCRRSCPPREGS